MLIRKNVNYRDIHGILLLDKPDHLTSNQALQQVKRLYNARKAGHAGTLDRSATGMLPVFFGRATKVISYTLNADKTYIVEAKLGAFTTTGDATGTIIKSSNIPEISQAKMRHLLDQFLGEMMQVPPMYSALKHQGKRLYQLAYDGIEVERAPRQIKVHGLRLLDLQKTQFKLYLRVSKGTYVRTLIEQIGSALDCGAYVSRLRRVSCGCFNRKDMVALAKLEQLKHQDISHLERFLLPLDIAVANLPKLSLSSTETDHLVHGRPIDMLTVAYDNDLCLYSNSNQFFGIGRIVAGRLFPKRIMSYSTS